MLDPLLDGCAAGAEARVDAIPNAQDHIATYKRIGTGDVPRDVVHLQCLPDGSGSSSQQCAAHFYLTVLGPIAGTNPRIVPTWQASKRLCQEAQHLRLEGLISNREHVISPRDVERPTR